MYSEAQENTQICLLFVYNNHGIASKNNHLSFDVRVILLMSSYITEEWAQCFYKFHFHWWCFDIFILLLSDLVTISI